MGSGVPGGSATLPPSRLVAFILRMRFLWISLSVNVISAGVLANKGPGMGGRFSGRLMATCATTSCFSTQSGRSRLNEAASFTRPSISPFSMARYISGVEYPSTHRTLSPSTSAMSLP